MHLDTQVVELLGRQRLIAELVHAGLEVAMPMRDRGIDLIAYAELSKQVTRFSARPIQMKASTAAGFGVYRKCEQVADLISAYVWHLEDLNAAVTYAMTHPQAVEIATEMGWTKKASWTVEGKYLTTKPSQRLIELMEPYRTSDERWWELVTGEKKPG